MIRTTAWTRFAGVILAVSGSLTQIPPLFAQSVPSGSSSSNQQVARPSTTSSDFFELLESGGDLLVSFFRPHDETPPVDQPRWNSLNSPRHTVETFLEAMRHVEAGREEAWPRALKTISIPEDNQLSGKQVAADLKAVLDRLPELSAGTLPGPEQVSDRDIRRYEIFPAGVDHQWIWDKASQAPRNAVSLKLTDGEEWKFDKETVQGIAELRENLRSIPPRENEDRQGELFLQTFLPMFENTPWWGWFTTLLGAGLGILAGWWGLAFFHRTAKSLEEQEHPVAGQACRAFGPPAVLFLLVIGILIGSGPLQVGATLGSYRWHFIELLLLVCFGWLLVEVIDLIVFASRKTLLNDGDVYMRMGTTILRRAIRVIVGVLLAVFVVQNALNVNLTAVLGGLGLATLAVSLAAQDAVKNLFGAMMVFVNRPFMVGDWISYDGRMGEVMDVSLQVTRIRLLSGEIWTVPNMHFTEDAIENLSLRKYLRREMNIQIPYDTQPEKILQAQELLHEILTSEDVTADGKCRPEEKEPSISFSHFGDYFLNLRVYYWYFMSPSGAGTQRQTERGWLSYLDHCSLVNQQIVERFNEEGIEFAFPTQSLQLSDDPRRELHFQMAEQASQAAESDHARTSKAG
ncbi:mechanosensitive ion channel family protein [bacterium]|nr:mechanosensitive ion channel family protein [bacterium]